MPERGLGLMIAGTVVVLDQVSKWAAEQWLAGRSLRVFDWFDLQLAYNKGAAFSFLSQAGGWQRWFFIAVASVAILVILAWLRRLGPGERPTAMALGLILGGALGNLIDRVLWGHVIDFIVWHYRHWYWPAFNVADSAISVGAVLLILAGFRPQPGHRE
ncbi:signal peptidase II [Thiohalobacter sp.]|uniref:signal peptidase II n=1 Tax=Thiohalobacter sp. TaxID=2025948 RepID=UPI002612CF3C|nr:signal peptidase II [Thiohalobacter sp.]